MESPHSDDPDKGKRRSRRLKVLAGQLSLFEDNAVTKATALQSSISREVPMPDAACGSCGHRWDHHDYRRLTCARCPCSIWS